MKKLYILILLLATGYSSQAQNLIFSTEQNIVEEMTEPSSSNYIRFRTPEAHVTTYRWTLIEENLPAGWDYSLCDYNDCYIGIPPTGVMETITLAQSQDGFEGFFSLSISHNDVEAEGYLELYVYDAIDSQNGDTVSWHISNGIALSIGDDQKEISFNVYPNPATQVLNIVAGENYHAIIYNIVGQNVMSFNGKMTETVDVSTLEEGIYILSLENEAGVISNQRFVKR